MHKTKEIVINTGPLIIPLFLGVLIRAKQDGFAFSMQEAINRMQSHGIYLSQKVIDFALNIEIGRVLHRKKVIGKKTCDRIPEIIYNGVFLPEKSQHSDFLKSLDIEPEKN